MGSQRVRHDSVTEQQQHSLFWASQVAQLVKNLPAMQETWVRFLGQDDPLEKEMATHSTVLAWEITWTEEPGELQSIRLQRVRHGKANEHPGTH